MIANVGTRMPLAPPMTGNGNHTIYKNGELGNETFINGLNPQPENALKVISHRKGRWSTTEGGVPGRTVPFDPDFC